MCSKISKYKQGQIWLANFPNRGKKHYVLIISNDNRNIFSNKVLIAPISHTKFMKHEQVAIDLFGKEDISYIQCADVTPLNKRDFVSYIGTLDSDVLDIVIDVLINNCIKGNYDFSDSFDNKANINIDDDENESSNTESNNRNTNNTNNSILKYIDIIKTKLPKYWADDLLQNYLYFFLDLKAKKQISVFAKSIGYKSSGSTLYRRYNQTIEEIIKRNLMSQDEINALLF